MPGLATTTSPTTAVRGQAAPPLRAPFNPPATSSSRTIPIPLQPTLFCPFAHFSLRFLFPVSPSPACSRSSSPSSLNSTALLASLPPRSPQRSPLLRASPRPVLPYIPSNPPPGFLYPACCLPAATGLILRAAQGCRVSGSA